MRFYELDASHLINEFMQSTVAAFMNAVYSRSKCHIEHKRLLVQISAVMEQIVQMQDDIHKVKKLMDTAFEKLGKQSSDALYDPAEAYADKDRIIELLNRLTSRMGEAEVSNLTATPKTDATMEEIMALKKSSHRVEMERQSINRRAGACVKGIL